MYRVCEYAIYKRWAFPPVHSPSGMICAVETKHRAVALHANDLCGTACLHTCTHVCTHARTRTSDTRRYVWRMIIANARFNFTDIQARNDFVSSSGRVAALDFSIANTIPRPSGKWFLIARYLWLIHGYLAAISRDCARQSVQTIFEILLDYGSATRINMR